MRRSVEKALELWLSEGLLTPEHAGRLGASIEEHQSGQDSSRAVAIFGSIGAVLSGLGAILFVASNWAGMSPLSRSFVMLGAYALVAGCAVLVERRGLARSANGVWLLATFVLGANIFLFAQTYNLSLTLWQGTLGWMIGALAMGYARRSPAQIAVAVPLGILTLGWMGGGSGWFFDDQMEFLFSDSGIRSVLALLGLSLVALSTLVERRQDLNFARVPCFRWGTLVAAGTLIISTAEAGVAEQLYTADFSIKQISVIVVAAVLVIAAMLKGQLDSAWSRSVLGITLGGLLMMFIPAGEGPWVGLELESGLHLLFGLYVVSVFALALTTIWLGIDAQDSRLVNLGMTSTALLIVIQYFGWSFQLLDRSLAFIVGGFVLIGLSMFVEKKRRQIVAQIGGEA